MKERVTSLLVLDRNSRPREDLYLHWNEGHAGRLRVSLVLAASLRAFFGALDRGQFTFVLLPSDEFWPEAGRVVSGVTLADMIARDRPSYRGRVLFYGPAVPGEEGVFTVPVGPDGGIDIPDADSRLEAALDRLVATFPSRAQPKGMQP